MKMLVLGGNGLAGHMIVQYFQSIGAMVDDMGSIEVVYTTRDPHRFGGLQLDVADYAAVAKLVEEVRPDVIVNAVVLLLQDSADDPKRAYWINGVLPNYLRYLADKQHARLIQISSDGVFNGSRGMRGEDDIPDGTTVYAHTKTLGEVRRAPHLTIRTSIVGPELRRNGVSLLKWFLGHADGDTVTGYTRVIWNGVTSLELAKAIRYALHHPEITGLVHLTSTQTTSKHDLLHVFAHVFERKIHIVPTTTPCSDHTLAQTRSDFQYHGGTYAQMVRELAEWMKTHENGGILYENTI
jgi:dTDP-4-dehydrorhamnose reductase